jgi:ribosomal protein L29
VITQVLEIEVKGRRFVEHIIGLSDDDLKLKLLDSAKILFRYKIKEAELKRNHLHKLHRKNTARILTEIRKREIESL